jgi:hypothetical protein
MVAGALPVRELGVDMDDVEAGEGQQRVAEQDMVEFLAHALEDVGIALGGRQGSAQIGEAGGGEARQSRRISGIVEVAEDGDTGLRIGAGEVEQEIGDDAGLGEPLDRGRLRRRLEAPEERLVLAARLQMRRDQHEAAAGHLECRDQRLAGAGEAAGPCVPGGIAGRDAPGIGVQRSAGKDRHRLRGAAAGPRREADASRIVEERHPDIAARRAAIGTVRGIDLRDGVARAAGRDDRRDQPVVAACGRHGAAVDRAVVVLDLRQRQDVRRAERSGDLAPERSEFRGARRAGQVLDVEAGDRDLARPRRRRGLRSEPARREVRGCRQQQAVVLESVIDDAGRVAQTVADPRARHRAGADQRVVGDQPPAIGRARPQRGAPARIGQRHAPRAIGGQRDLAEAVARADRLRVAQDDAHALKALVEIERVASGIGRVGRVLDRSPDGRRDTVGWRASGRPDDDRGGQGHVARDPSHGAGLDLRRRETVGTAAPLADAPGDKQQVPRSRIAEVFGGQRHEHGIGGPGVRVAAGARILDEDAPARVAGQHGGHHALDLGDIRAEQGGDVAHALDVLDRPRRRRVAAEGGEQGRQDAEDRGWIGHDAASLARRAAARADAGGVGRAGEGSSRAIPSVA